MPKVIQPRRHDKQLTAQQFWEIRDQNKINQPTRPQVFRDEEVEHRHRFNKPSELAKVFNPLAYFLNASNDRPISQQLIDEDQDTFVARYLLSVCGRIAPAIKDVKKLVFGRKSIIHNRDQVLELLWNNLEFEDSWCLLQALIKDTRGTSIDSWLSSGLPHMAEIITQQATHDFKPILFKGLFDCLAILLEGYFQQICARLEEFFSVFADCFLKHGNKYIRKFALVSISYLFENLEEEQFSTFLTFLMKLLTEGFFDQKLRLGTLLAQRVRVVRGGLSTSSLALCLHQLQQLMLIPVNNNIAEEKQGIISQNALEELVSDYLLAVLGLLNNKYGGHQEQVIFDFNYILKALITLSNQRQGKYPAILVSAFAKFMGLYTTNPERFRFRTQLEQDYLNTMWNTFGQFFLTHCNILTTNIQIDLSLSLLTLRSKHHILYNKQILEYFRNRGEARQKLIQLSYQEETPLDQQLLQLILVVMKDSLFAFWNQKESQLCKTIYSLLVLLRRSNFNRLLELEWIGIDSSLILERLSNCRAEDELLVSLRLLSFIRLDQNLASPLTDFKNTLLKPYAQYLQGQLELQIDWDSSSPQDYFKADLLSRQTIIFSHQEIPWLSHIFNLIQAFTILEKQLILNAPHHENNVWRELMNNRQSVVQLLIQQDQQMSEQMLLRLVGSRRRSVRLIALTFVRQRLQKMQGEGKQKVLEVIQSLMGIDKQEINLENEREVKMILGNLERALPEIKIVMQKRYGLLMEVLLQWGLGFAFTGFKLIQKFFISFFSKLINFGFLSSRGHTYVSQRLIPFLRYYNYRHSRKQQLDLSEQNKTTLHLAHRFSIQTDPSIKSLVAQDLDVEQIESMQWIGVLRIASAIQASSEGKQHLQPQLSKLVKAYFQIEFPRQQNFINNGQQHAELIGSNSPLLLPIKTRFLSLVLKLCPDNYLPPMQCLHFVKSQYLDLKSTRKIKRSSWEQVWQKKGKNKKQVERVSAREVDLSSISAEQQIMYLNFLWKDLLEANHHKKRVIVQHVRNCLSGGPQQLIDMFFNTLTITKKEIRKGKLTVQILAVRLKLMNRRSLLNCMFILKVFLGTLRSEISQKYEELMLLILTFIEIAHHSQQKQEDGQDENQDQDIQQEEDQDQSQQILGQEQQNQPSRKQNNPYKQHRKQLQKLLQTLLANHQLDSQTLQHLLRGLFIHTRINLPKASRSSVPGLLHVLNIIAQDKNYCPLLLTINEGQLMPLLSSMIALDDQGKRPLKICYQLWLSIMTGILAQPEEQMIDEAMTQQSQKLQAQIKDLMSRQTSSCLSAILSYLKGRYEQEQNSRTSRKKKGNNRGEQEMKLLTLIKILFSLHQIQSTLDVEWGDYLLSEIGRVAKNKQKLTDVQFKQLSSLVEILSRFLVLQRQASSSIAAAFLKKTVPLLPVLKDLTHRNALTRLIADSYQQLELSQKIVELVAQTCKVSQVGLIIKLDFKAFFASCSEYMASVSTFPVAEQEYFLFHLLSYLDYEEISVRRVVAQCVRCYLTAVGGKLSGEQIIGQSVGLVVKLFRATLQLWSGVLSAQQTDMIFWSAVQNLQLYVRWFSDNHQQLQPFCSNPSKPILQNYKILSTPAINEHQPLLLMMSAISDSNKLKGLKYLQQILNNLEQPEIIKNQMQQQRRFTVDLPDPLQKIILPIIEHLVMQPTRIEPNTPTNNLGSSLALSSLELMPTLIGLLPSSAHKQTLKKLISKLKSCDLQNQSKKSIAIVKMISQVVEGVPGPKATVRVKEFIGEHGFEAFHSKVMSRARAVEEQDEGDSEDDRKDAKRKIDFFDHLQELQSEEAIQRNFMRFDKNLGQIEEDKQQGNQLSSNYLSSFLMSHVLPPLRSLLMLQSRSSSTEDVSRAKLMISVATTKVLLRLSFDTFMRQFQKIVVKLGRLLKKRQFEARQNARNCLCQIAKTVGPQLLYTIVMTLKYNLKDNFQGHVLNFTIFKVLEAMQLKSGDLDYCVPLLLPIVVDDIFGSSADQKDMVQKGQAPTIKKQAKKRKGQSLMQLICQVISHQKIGFLIDFLQRYLSEHLTSQQNLGKYEQMLGIMSSGLGVNPQVIDSNNASVLLSSIAEPVSQLRRQLKWTAEVDGPRHDNSVKKSWVRSKAGKDQVLSLQDETGRNKSIFTRIAKDASEYHSKDIISSCLIQFHLTLASLLVKKQILSIKILTDGADLVADSANMLTLLSFLVDCVDHRDNRLVAKSLKILHMTIIWKMENLDQKLSPFIQKFKSLKKSASRKILLLAEQLTLADQQLLRDCFMFLCDVVGSISITGQMLPSFVSLIKLHSPTSDEQPHIAQTYRLLRTLLLKVPAQLYNHLLVDLRGLVRMQVVGCRNQDIRSICKNILALYLRQEASVQPAIDVLNLNKKKEHKNPVKYQQLIKEQITFLLTHLESEGQDLVLELLSEFFAQCQVNMTEQLAELSLMSLMTARTNQISELATLGDRSLPRDHPTDTLIKDIIKKVDTGKVLGCVEKCVAWMGGERNSSVRLCGYSLLRLILLSRSELMSNKSFCSKYLLGQEGVFSSLLKLLKVQEESFKLMTQLEGRGKVDSRWGDIMDSIEGPKEAYQLDLSIYESLHLLTILSSKNILNSSEELPQILSSMWKLLHHDNNQLVTLLLQVISLNKIYPTIATHFTPKQGQNDRESVKKVVSTLIFKGISEQHIQNLLQQIIREQAATEDLPESLKNNAWFLVGLALKAHIKSKAYYEQLPVILGLLNHAVLTPDLKGLNCRTMTFQLPNFKQKLLQMASKLTTNDQISPQSKDLVNETTEILKEELGVGHYFEAVSQLQVRRRKVRTDEKARVSEMAVVDPEAFVAERRKKKRKIE